MYRTLLFYPVQQLWQPGPDLV